MLFDFAHKLRYIGPAAIESGAIEQTDISSRFLTLLGLYQLVAFQDSKPLGSLTLMVPKIRMRASRHHTRLQSLRHAAHAARNEGSRDE